MPIKIRNKKSNIEVQTVFDSVTGEYKRVVIDRETGRRVQTRRVKYILGRPILVEDKAPFSVVTVGVPVGQKQNFGPKKKPAVYRNSVRGRYISKKKVVAKRKLGVSDTEPAPPDRNEKDKGNHS